MQFHGHGRYLAVDPADRAPQRSTEADRTAVQTSGAGIAAELELRMSPRHRAIRTAPDDRAERGRIELVFRQQCVAQNCVDRPVAWMWDPNRFQTCAVLEDYDAEPAAWMRQCDPIHPTLVSKVS